MWRGERDPVGQDTANHIASKAGCQCLGLGLIVPLPTFHLGTKERDGFFRVVFASSAEILISLHHNSASCQVKLVI